MSKNLFFLFSETINVNMENYRPINLDAEETIQRCSWTSKTMDTGVKKRVSARVVHMIRSENLGKTLGETLWRISPRLVFFYAGRSDLTRQTIKRSTRTPKTMKISTWTSKTIVRSIWTLKAVERPTRMPQIRKDRSVR